MVLLADAADDDCGVVVLVYACIFTDVLVV